MTCANGHPAAPGATICRACGAPVVRVCANGHPLPPGFQLCSACGAFAAAAPATPLPAPNRGSAAATTWVYVGCGLAVLFAVALVAALLLWPKAPPEVTAAPGPPRAISTTTSSRPPTSTTTTTRRSNGGLGLNVSPDELKAELKNQGMDPTQANCIVDGLLAKGVDLSTFDRPTAAEQRVLTEVVTRCVSGG